MAEAIALNDLSDYRPQGMWLFSNVHPKHFEARGHFNDGREIDGLIFYHQMQEYVTLIDTLGALPDTVVTLRPDFEEDVQRVRQEGTIEKYVS
jgi:hypothetical protein